MVKIDEAIALAAAHVYVEREYRPGRERSLVLTKIEEAELWLTRCERWPGNRAGVCNLRIGAEKWCTLPDEHAGPHADEVRA